MKEISFSILASTLTVVKAILESPTVMVLDLPLKRLTSWVYEVERDAAGVPAAPDSPVNADEPLSADAEALSLSTGVDEASAELTPLLPPPPPPPEPPPALLLELSLLPLLAAAVVKLYVPLVLQLLTPSQEVTLK